jgi:hypothetical protein
MVQTKIHLMMASMLNASNLGAGIEGLTFGTSVKSMHFLCWNQRNLNFFGVQVKKACNKILTQLDLKPFAHAPVPVPAEPKMPPGQRRLVGRVILVPPYPLGWLARGCFGVWSQRRRFKALCCALVLLGILALAICIGVLVHRSRSNLSVIHGALVTAATIPTTPISAGSLQLDVSVQMSRPATIWYAVVSADRPIPDSSDVVDVAKGIALTPMSEGTLACGEVFVPIAEKNFTFTIAPSRETSECSLYASLEASIAEARLKRCSRCSMLLPNTLLKVLSPFLIGVIWCPTAGKYLKAKAIEGHLSPFKCCNISGFQT